MNYSFASSHLLGRNLMGGFELFYMVDFFEIASAKDA
jgi:hypothetical protein